MIRASKQAFKKLAWRRYDVARAYQRLRLGLAFSEERLPVVLLQMGKVGSRTVWRSLLDAELDVPVWHLHYLSDEIIGRLESLYRQTWPEGNAVHLWRCQFLREKLDRGLGGLKIITLTRDPVSRNISSFFESCQFQPLERPGAYRVRSVDYDFEARISSDDLRPLTSLFLEQLDHETPLVFFDREFRAVLGIDVYSREFPKSKGYEIYRDRRADVLVIRLEDLANCAGEAMNAFLRLDDFKLINANVGREKDYGPIYEQFKKSVRLPKSYLDEMYGSRYAQHFYTDAEISAFRARWLEEG